MQQRLHLRLGATVEVKVLDLLLCAQELPPELATGSLELSDARVGGLDRGGARGVRINRAAQLLRRARQLLLLEVHRELLIGDGLLQPALLLVQLLH